MIKVSLAFAPTATTQLYTQITLQQGSTLYTALKQTGWLEAYEDLARWCENNQHVTESNRIDKKSWRVGIYSIKKPLNHILSNNDRIEVYRPLTIDPQHRRKARANK